MGARSSNNNKGLNHISDGHLLEYFRNTFVRGGGGTNPPPAFGSPLGFAATGGVIADYSDPGSGKIYRAHIFTSSGTFNVTGPGSFDPDGIQYLVVGGGGGGGASGPAGNAGGGGGGAGGLRTNLPGVVDAAASPLTAPSYTIPAFPTSYTVTIGGGGVGRTKHALGGQGGTSEFYPTPQSYPSTTRIRSVGGGGGGFETPNTAGSPGGSGGAGGRSSVGGSGNSPSDPNHPIPMGKDGYGPGGGGQSGGGGGAGEAGQVYNPPQGGRGGDGVKVAIAGSPTFNGLGGLNPGPGEYQWFAGGGGGGGIGPGPEIRGGYGGGGRGGQAPPTASPKTWDYEVQNGTYATGGGGGGGSAGPTAYEDLFKSGHGGSGVVVVRYQIGRLNEVAKASGGSISYYNNKTIHTFLNSGTFTAPATFNETVEYLVVGGGGGGGAEENSTGSGGGGAGAYRTATTPISGPQSITIQVGAGGRGGLAPGPAGPNPVLQGIDGTSSYFGVPITAPGGGGGAGNYPANGNPGGSGGGGKQGSSGGGSSGDTFPGTIGATPTNGWGHDGGSGVSSPPHSLGGGGGGAGSIGTNGTATQNGSAGYGGFGVQAPSTFRNPASSVGAPGPTGTYYTNGDNTGKYWFAGGGGAGASGSSPGSVGKGGSWNGSTAVPGGPWSGAGDGSSGTDPAASALSNTGSGGGGAGAVTYAATPGGSQGGNGGSGIVIIAYPS